MPPDHFFCARNSLKSIQLGKVSYQPVVPLLTSPIGQKRLAQVVQPLTPTVEWPREDRSFFKGCARLGKCNCAPILLHLSQRECFRRTPPEQRIQLARTTRLRQSTADRTENQKYPRLTAYFFYLRPATTPASTSPPLVFSPTPRNKLLTKTVSHSPETTGKTDQLALGYGLAAWPCRRWQTQEGALTRERRSRHCGCVAMRVWKRHDGVTTSEKAGTKTGTGAKTGRPGAEGQRPSVDAAVTAKGLVSGQICSE